MKSLLKKAGLLSISFIALLAACTAGAPAASRQQADGRQLGWDDQLDANGRLNVVTTVAPISSIVRNVGGDRINLRGIIPDGTDSHTFEPAPSDARVLAQADLVIVNGLHLETPTEKMAQANARSGAAIKSLGDNTITERDWIFDFSFPKEEGDPNPHLWMNPQYAMKYAELTKTWLSERDPGNKDYYQRNYDAYGAKLTALDQAIEKAVATVPQANRRLLTYHDSWAYFARRYGMQVIGAVQPSDFSEPSAQDVTALITQIKQEKVPAIFGSEVFPSKVLEQIARESGAQYIDKLSDDEPPGQPGSPEHTYIGMMLEDMNNMIPALGGRVDALKGIDPADSFTRS